MKIITTLLLPAVFFFITSCSSSKKERKLTGDDVVRMINHYEADSLRAIMDTVFVMDFDFISFQGNAKTFLTEIVSSSKATAAYYEILETKKPDERSFQYIVKDRSAFDKYFNLDPPKMLLTIVINDSNRFEKIFIDSMPGYHHYDRELTNKFKSFDDWLKQKYPEDMLQYLMQAQDGKLVARLKEYSQQ